MFPVQCPGKNCFGTPWVGSCKRFAGAEPLHDRALAIKEKALGPEHPDVATSAKNLAGLFRNTKRQAEAEPLRSGSALVRSLRQVEKQDTDYQIDRQQLHALKPIRFAVTVDLKN